MPSASSIDSIVDCIDAVLTGPHVDESTHCAGGRSDPSEIDYINRNVQAIIDQQRAIIADLSAKVSFPLSYLGLQDIHEI